MAQRLTGTVGKGCVGFLVFALPTALLGFFVCVAVAIGNGGVAQHAGLPDALLGMCVLAWLVATFLCFFVVAFAADEGGGRASRHA